MTGVRGACSTWEAGRADGTTLPKGPREGKSLCLMPRWARAPRKDCPRQVLIQPAAHSRRRERACSARTGGFHFQVGAPRLLETVFRENLAMGLSTLPLRDTPTPPSAPLL